MPSLDRVPPSSHSHAVISSDIYLYPDIYDLHHYDHWQSPSSSHSRKFSGSVITIFPPRSTLHAECLVTTFHCLQLCGLARARVWRGEQTRDKRVSASGWLPGTPPPERRAGNEPSRSLKFYNHGDMENAPTRDWGLLMVKSAC